MSGPRKEESHGWNRSFLESVGTDQGSNDANDTPKFRGALDPGVCPRYLRCSSPVCPLDANWQLRKHLEGESVCGLLLELAKDGGEATLRTSLSEHVALAVVTLAPSILASNGMVRRACERATLTGSRLKNFQKMSGARRAEAKVFA